MVIYENILIGGNAYVKAYSDSMLLIHGGSPESDYSEAFDPENSGRTYTETSVPVDASEAEMVLSVLLGGAL